jgi:RHS repeat-associated protein
MLALLCATGSLGVTMPVLAATTVIQYTYDAGDNVTTVTDPRGLVTAYSYDGLGQLWGVSSPDTGTTTANYDAYGRRSNMTRANSVTTTYGYDAVNRPISITAGGQTQSFAYDSCTNGLGRLCSTSDATGTTAYTYTPEGWIAGRGFSISGTGYSLGYGYDAMGHLAAVTYPDGHQAIYSYSNGAVSGITFKIGSTQLTAASGVTWQPMNAGLSSWTSSNGLANTLSSDTDGRLIAINTPGVESLGFSYDSADRLTGINNVLDGTVSQNFGYDDESRLVSMYSLNQGASYSYDANGNRIAAVQGGASSNTYYSSTSNQIVNSTGANPQSYGHDALGNITTLGGVVAYQYDAFNRMSAASGTNYYVNPEGQRLREAGSAGVAYFAPDVSGPLLAEYSNGGWIDYVWLNGYLIGREVNGQLEAIHNDQVGRPQVVTNASQTVVWSAQNWPFTRNVMLSSSAPLNIGFPGQYYDTESGLWNNGFRDYDSTLGRYVESDPIGLAGGSNTYAYAGGNPGMFTDPEGLAFGINMGECYGEAAAQYWADKADKTGNPLYNIPGAVASLWTRDTSNKTAIVLTAAYLVRNAGSTWSLRDGSLGYTPIDAGSLMRVERHMTGSAKAGNRAMAWHSHLGGSGHLPSAVGIGVTGGLLGLAAAAWNGDIGKNDFKCGCDQ